MSCNNLPPVQARTAARQSRTWADGFTLVEAAVVCAVAAALATVALPAVRGQNLRAGRLDGVHALARVQQAQEQYRLAHGLYAGDLSALLGTASRSTQGLYDISLSVNGLSYVATARARGTQAGDADCPSITLQVNQGFAQQGPTARCWVQ